MISIFAKIFGPKVSHIPKWVLMVLLSFIIIAILHPFIANDVPLIAKNEKGISSPVFQKLCGQQIEDISTYKWKVMPIIPYSANTIDFNNSNYKSPFKSQQYTSLHQRHWLGTDRLGRDTLAGLLYGAWIALVVGVFAALFSVIIGVIVGMISAYFGDNKMKLNLIQLLLLMIFLIVTSYQLSNGLVYGTNIDFLLELTVFGLFSLFVGILIKLCSSLQISQFSIPFDSIVLRILELFKSIPKLFLILALLSIVKQAQVADIIWIIALVTWPISCRYTRAEVLAVQEENYIQSAEGLGISNMNILFKHLLPNILGPALITFAFTVSSAIVLEAVLSFLGLGLSVDQVTWGSMLAEVRQYYKAWWLVLFPGLLLFLIVITFNKLSEHISLSLKKA